MRRALETANTAPHRGRGVTSLTLTLLFIGIGLTDWLVTQHLHRYVALLIKALIAVAFFAYARWVLGLTNADMGLERRSARQGLKEGAVVAAMILGAIFIIVVIPASRGYFTSSRVQTDSANLHWLEPLLIIPFGTVIFEELIFRGVLLGAALTRWSVRTAVIVTSITFGMWHLADVIHISGSSSNWHMAGAALGTVAVTSVAGLLFAILRLRTSSLIAPILAHFAFDVGAYVAALTALRLWG